MVVVESNIAAVATSAKAYGPIHDLSLEQKNMINISRLVLMTEIFLLYICRQDILSQVLQL